MRIKSYKMGKVYLAIWIFLILDIIVAVNPEAGDSQPMDEGNQDNPTASQLEEDVNTTRTTATRQATVINTTIPEVTNITQSESSMTRLRVTDTTETSVTETSVTKTTSLLNSKMGENVNDTAQADDICPALNSTEWTIVTISRLNVMINKMSEPNCKINTQDLEWTNCTRNNVSSAMILINDLLELIQKGNQLYAKCRTDFCSAKYNPMANKMEVNIPLPQMKVMLQQAIRNCDVDTSFVRWTSRFDVCYNITRAIMPLSDFYKLLSKGQEKCVQEHCKPPFNPNSRMHSNVTEGIVITKVYVLSTICFAGIIGNILSFLTLSKMEKVNTSIFILKMLAIVDGIHLLLRIVLEPYYTAYTYTDWIAKSTNELNETTADQYMKVVHYAKPLIEMAQMASAWLVVFLTLDRFIAICFPFKALSLCTMKMAKTGVSIVIIGSCLYIVPVYFGYVYKWQRNECTKLFFINIIVSPLGQNIFYRVVYELALNLIFRNVLPVCLVLGMNARLVHELRASRKRRLDITSKTTPEDNKKDKNITITLISISFVFLVCIIPMVALKVWDIINYSILKQELPGAGVLIVSKYSGSYTGSIIYSMVVDLLLGINSAINIIVYCLVRKNFTSNMYKMFVCKEPQMLAGRTTQATISGTRFSKGSNSNSGSAKSAEQSKDMTAL